MVQIVYPDRLDDTNTHQPIFAYLKKGDQLLRVTTQESHFKFRRVMQSSLGNPINERFDHILEPDKDRKILYAAPVITSSQPDNNALKHALFCCLAEVLGATMVFESRKLIGTYKVTQDVQLLDLRTTGSMGVGTVAAIMSIDDREKTQCCSKALYELYPEIDGLLYSSAHNQFDSVALYERCDNKLEYPNASNIRTLENLLYEGNGNERDYILEFMESHRINWD